MDRAQHFYQEFCKHITRRWFFKQCGVGLGAIALRSLLQDEEAQAATPTAVTNPLAPRQPHYPARAKRVVFIFMSGGPSHLELYDNKPMLTKYDGKLPPPDLLKGYRTAFIHPDAKLLGPKFKFARHGKSGVELSELLPNLATLADDLCVVKSLVTDAFNHAPAQILMTTGSQIFGRPSLGAWATYGLGSESQELPGFVVLNSGEKGTSGGAANWGSGFLPSVYQGVLFRGSGDPILYLNNPRGVDRQLQRDSLDVIRRLNEKHFRDMGDPEIATRINSFEMAFRMQSSAPELMDLSREPKRILEMYGAEPGKGSFANNCLLARRLLERGVRFVQICHEAWDHHGGLTEGLKTQCKLTDKPCAALVRDLKERGLLKDTLVIWGGEFGRTPMVQGGSDGRDHHPNAFAMWFAGGGVKPGFTLGSTDDFGFNAVTERMHVHDLHATLLHLLGFDHTRLTFRFQGRDFRLTDVSGNIAEKMLA